MLAFADLSAALLCCLRTLFPLSVSRLSPDLLPISRPLIAHLGRKVSEGNAQHFRPSPVRARDLKCPECCRQTTLASPQPLAIPQSAAIHNLLCLPRLSHHFQQLACHDKLRVRSSRAARRALTLATLR